MIIIVTHPLLTLCFLHFFPYDRLPGKKTRTKDPGKKAPVHCDLLTPSFSLIFFFSCGFVWEKNKLRTSANFVH